MWEVPVLLLAFSIAQVSWALAKWKKFGRHIIGNEFDTQKMIFNPFVPDTHYGERWDKLAS